MRRVEGDLATIEPGRDDDPVPVARCCIAGILMGLANLVPGISGGTMILVMGIYDRFVTAVADVSRLRMTRRNVLFLGCIVGAAGLSIVALAGTLSRAVTLHPCIMYSLFIGLTLGGAPALIGMLKGITSRVLTGVALGLGVMILIAVTRDEPPNREAVRQAVAAGSFIVEPAYARDFAAGVLGIAAMILPGISGAYMLLILNRYESILAAIALTKEYAFSLGADGDPTVFLRVIIPTALGSVLSLVLFSNLLKWMLHRHESISIGLLLGILLGSVVGIWPFDGSSGPTDYLIGLGVALGGFAVTIGLSRA